MIDSNPPLDRAEDVRGLLTRCCEGLCPAAVITRDPTLLSHGRFAEVTQDLVAIDLFQLPSQTVIWPRSIGCISFHHGDRSRVFLSEVRDFVTVDGAPPRLVLELPTAIGTADVRRSIRVPLLPDTGLRVKVGPSGAAPRILNVSLGGVLLQFEAGADPDAAVEDRLELVLSLGALEVSLVGVVRRRRSLDYALFFLDVPGPELEILGQIVRTVERAWIMLDRAVTPRTEAVVVG